jgi:hypothetical protein
MVEALMGSKKGVSPRTVTVKVAPGTPLVEPEELGALPPLLQPIAETTSATPARRAQPMLPP